MSWLFSQALVAEYSEANSSDGEQCAQLSVMPTQHKFWRNDKTMEFSRLSQFGLTCAVLTENRGEELLTLFRAGFHARTSLVPEQVQESKENVLAYGVNSPASLAKYDRDTSSWKTPQCSQAGELTLFSGTWPRWGFMQDGALFLHPRLERSTDAKECGLWPTPTCGGFTSTGAIKATIRMAETISEASAMTGRHGVVMRMAGQKAVSGKEDGQLNPPWVEWLMGWPIGWTDLKPLEMDKFQEWQQQHSEFYQANEDAA